MLNQTLKLNTKLWNDDVEQLPIRNGFGEGLVLAGTADESIVGLCADLTESTKMNAFADKFPKRFIQVGVAEQNLATVAWPQWESFPLFLRMRCFLQDAAGSKFVQPSHTIMCRSLS